MEFRIADTFTDSLAKLTGEELFRAISHEFGLITTGLTRAQLLDQLNAFLLAQTQLPGEDDRLSPETIVATATPTPQPLPTPTPGEITNPLAELQRLRLRHSGEFACSMLVSRRVYPDAPSHRLGTLVEYKCLPASGTFHRALADAEMTAHLWLRMLDDISDRHRIKAIPFALMQELSRVPRAAATGYLERWRQQGHGS